MTIVATRTGEETGRTHRTIGLSGRLILLTAAFVMLAEILIYLPALASFRRSWLNDRIMGAQIVVLALSARPQGDLSSEVERRLVAGIKGAQAIGVRGPGTRWLLATAGEPLPRPTRDIDLRNPPWYGPLRGAIRTLLSPGPTVTRLIGPGMLGIPGVEWVEVVLDERPLRRAMLAFTRNFLLVSLIIASITAALLYYALDAAVIRPVRRLSANIAAFASDPEDAERIIAPSGRTDELGVAEEALARMETRLAGELRQKRRLADLGLAVSKINHELRNMLTTAQLLGDRLGELDDPTVQRFAPRLVRTLARAIEFCGATLAYGRASEPTPQRRLVPLAPIVMELTDFTALADGLTIEISTEIESGLLVDADPEQLSRALANLVRNAVEALAQAGRPGGMLSISAARADTLVRIRIADNGPGVPESVRPRLFGAFQSSGRSGGSGLGLAIAEELVRLHGGGLVLEETTEGASFLITIPDREIPPPNAA